MPTEFRASDRHVYRLIAGEHLLMDLQSKNPFPYFALTPTAALLWGSLKEWTEADALAVQLRERYELPPEKAAADVEEFLSQLDSIGAVQRRERKD